MKERRRKTGLYVNEMRKQKEKKWWFCFSLFMFHLCSFFFFFLFCFVYLFTFFFLFPFCFLSFLYSIASTRRRWCNDMQSCGLFFNARDCRTQQTTARSLSFFFPSNSFFFSHLIFWKLFLGHSPFFFFLSFLLYFHFSFWNLRARRMLAARWNVLL